MLEVIWQYPFLQRALIAALIVGLVCSVMGVFVVFNRMAFFADAVAHSALAGIAIGLLAGVSTFWSAMVFGIAVALVSIYLKSKARLNIDTVLGLFLPFSMALGILLLGFRGNYTPDLVSYLFGSILSVSWLDIVVMIVLTIVAFFWLRLNYKKMLAIVFDRDLAYASGIKVEYTEYVFVILMSMIVVASIQVVGIVLVGGLIVIPAATARNVVKSFGQMIWMSGIFGILSGLLGLILAYYLDIASGSAIIMIAMGLFIISFIFRSK